MTSFVSLFVNKAIVGILKLLIFCLHWHFVKKRSMRVCNLVESPWHPWSVTCFKSESIYIIFVGENIVFKELIVTQCFYKCKPLLLLIANYFSYQIDTLLRIEKSNHYILIYMVLIFILMAFKWEEQQMIYLFIKNKGVCVCFISK